MLKTLLGHWKTHRKKPSLLPKEEDVPFDDPTTINPLFEDSDSSIISAQEPTEIHFSENIQTTSEPELKQIFKQEETNALVDLEVPINHKDDPTNDVTGEQVLQSSVHNFNSDDVKNDEPKTLENDHENLVKLKLPTTNNSLRASKENVSLETKENMRIYQPSTSAISNDRKSHISSFNAQNKEVPKPFTSKSIEIRNTDNALRNGEKELKEESETLKQKNKNTSSTSKSNGSDNPQNLRARAIDELIKKFQSKSTENDKANKTQSRETHKTQSNVSESAPNEPSTSPKSITKTETLSNINSENDIILSGITKVEQNGSPTTPKSILKSEKSRNIDVKKESLSNIFKFPPPPPIENLVQESSLHGRILAKKSKPQIREAISSNNIIGSETISENIEQGTTRSDSSLERTRTASSVKLKENMDNTETNSANESTVNIPKPAVRESFLHSPKSREMCPIKKAQLSQNEKDLKFKTDETSVPSTSTKNGKQVASSIENTKDQFVKTEALAPKVRAYKNNKFSATNRENVKINLTEEKTRNSQPFNSENVVLDKSVTLNDETSNEEVFRKSTSKDADLNKGNSQAIRSTDVILARKESIKEAKDTDISDRKESTREAKDTIISDRKESLREAKDVGTNFSNEDINETTNKLDPPKHILKSSLSKSSSKINMGRETENVKSHSEDSGITRGDQISSEATQDTSPTNVLNETNAATNPKKPRREKKVRSTSRNSCTKCKKSHTEDIPMKGNLYDDYYDVLTGATHSYASKHSDSLTSELSWEERELLRRLRKHKDTVRSKTPSTRSRLSRYKYMDETQFRKYRNNLRSSEESSLYGSSLCSCDKCWSKYVRDYAYARASLRGMPPIHEMCTCQSSRSNFLGRRVQFKSDPIPEVPTLEKTTRTTSPASNAEDSKQKTTTSDDKVSEKSSELKGSDSVSQNSKSQKEKKLKFSEEEYRIVTPWELENWDYLVRRQVIQKRRKRARCMGLIALAIVIFIGLVVAILMVYLRRKTL